MGRALLVIALVLAVSGLAVVEDHKDAGVGLVIAAAIAVLFSAAFVRKFAWETVSQKPSKLKLTLLASLAVFFLSLFAFGPATTFEHISAGIDNFVQWLQKVIDGFRDGNKP